VSASKANDANDGARPDARLELDLTALRRGIVAGSVLIVPISFLGGLLNHERHHGNSGWLFVAFVAILYGYAVAGYGAARTRPDTPLAHGIIAGLGAFLVWLIVSLGVRLARGEHLGFGVVDVVSNALLAVALGAVGGMLAARKGPTALPRD
jgi:hypothetical protein